MFRFDRRCSRQFVLQSGEDLDAFDRIDAEIRIKRHLKFKHLDRVTGFAGNHFQQRRRHRITIQRTARCKRCCRCSALFAGSCEIINNLTEGLQHAKIFWFDRRSLREFLLQCREDLNTLDRIDTKVGVEGHLHLKHLNRIASLFCDHFEQHACNAIAINSWLCSGLCYWRVSDHTCAQVIDNLTKRLQHTQIFRFHCRSFRQFFLERREDFNSFDRIDAEVGVESHLHLKHLDRIAGLLGDHFEQHA